MATRYITHSLEESKPPLWRKAGVILPSVLLGVLDTPARVWQTRTCELPPEERVDAVRKLVERVFNVDSWNGQAFTNALRRLSQRESVNFSEQTVSKVKYTQFLSDIRQTIEARYAARRQAYEHLLGWIEAHKRDAPLPTLILDPTQILVNDRCRSHKRHELGMDLRNTKSRQKRCVIGPSVVQALWTLLHPPAEACEERFSLAGAEGPLLDVLRSIQPEISFNLSRMNPLSPLSGCKISKQALRDFVSALTEQVDVSRGYQCAKAEFLIDALGREEMEKTIPALLSELLSGHTIRLQPLDITRLVERLGLDSKVTNALVSQLNAHGNSTPIPPSQIPSLNKVELCRFLSLYTLNMKSQKVHAEEWVAELDENQLATCGLSLAQVDFLWSLLDPQQVNCLQTEKVCKFSAVLVEGLPLIVQSSVHQETAKRFASDSPQNYLSVLTGKTIDGRELTSALEFLRVEAENCLKALTQEDGCEDECLGKLWSQVLNPEDRATQAALTLIKYVINATGINDTAQTQLQEAVALTTLFGPGLKQADANTSLLTTQRANKVGWPSKYGILP
eukprot:Blabericola_migrator_1__7261@NODE_368_length_9339_cov_86_801014_g295_i0_p2_GENE_NODE_368_length_9339_cov_86_801014_g295_i0NODE_368_length_9339_cov_86_801014_g295_i0_p2_ORF_typecomplete_len564_score69_33AbfS_sensor/PF18225_1/7_9e03AbfS_sensor/PF18225_1/5_3AbfS_sensor/PF18225_1/1_5e02_NODE_368_length_9339_cov_86_801014_g295_i073499040